jgi:recombinational DNA repair protein RecR
MERVSLINGHIDGYSDNAEHCVCCGKVIPEGTQYCTVCAEIMRKGSEGNSK